LPVLPIRYGPSDICILYVLAAPAQQQHKTPAGLGVIHPVARPEVDAKFPDPIPAKFVIAEISMFEPGHASNDRYLGLLSAVR